MELLGVFIVTAVAGLLLARRYPLTLFRLLLKLARGLLRMSVRTTAVDGLQWVYLDSATQPHRQVARPVLLLVHGFGADKHMWLAYALRFRRHYRVIAPDLPGFGDTTPDPAADYSPRTQAARLQRFCEVLQLDQVHVAGSSMGGFIAAWLAVDFPSRVQSLTLMNAAGVFGANASPVQTAAEGGRNPLVATSADQLTALLALLVHRPPWLPRFVRSALVIEFGRRELLWQQIFWQLVDAQLKDDLEPMLDRIFAPTLIIWGREDHIIDISCADVFASRITGSRSVRFDAVGHVPMFEAPAATASAHADFLIAAAR